MFLRFCPSFWPQGPTKNNQRGRENISHKVNISERTQLILRAKLCVFIKKIQATGEALTQQQTKKQYKTTKPMQETCVNIASCLSSIIYVSVEPLINTKWGSGKVRLACHFIYKYFLTRQGKIWSNPYLWHPVANKPHSIRAWQRSIACLSLLVSALGNQSPKKVSVRNSLYIVFS